MKPLIFGVAGGSGSGKTYFARDIQRIFGDKICSVVYQDNFYFDQSKNFDYDGGSVNFDHPDSIDFELLNQTLLKLKMGQEVEVPLYDFATHSRKPETIKVKPTPIVLVDGILILSSAELRNTFDKSIFFDTPEELRYARRLKRDVEERGRTAQGVYNQFFNQVKPMHDLFVQPSAQFANWTVKDIGAYQNTLQEIAVKLKSLVKLQEFKASPFLY